MIPTFLNRLKVLVLLADLVVDFSIAILFPVYCIFLHQELVELLILLILGDLMLQVHQKEITNIRQFRLFRLYKRQNRHFFRHFHLFLLHFRWVFLGWALIIRDCWVLFRDPDNFASHIDHFLNEISFFFFVELNFS